MHRVKHNKLMAELNDYTSLVFALLSKSIDVNQVKVQNVLRLRSSQRDIFLSRLKAKWYSFVDKRTFHSVKPLICCSGESYANSIFLHPHSFYVTCSHVYPFNKERTIYLPYWLTSMRLDSVPNFSTYSRFGCPISKSDVFHCLPTSLNRLHKIVYLSSNLNNARLELINKIRKIIDVDVVTGTNVSGQYGKNVTKKDLYARYKFALCLENTIEDGYITEKIVEAFAAGCIPIVYSHPSITDYFNSEAFIDLMHLQLKSSFEDALRDRLAKTNLRFSSAPISLFNDQYVVEKEIKNFHSSIARWSELIF